jgi:D-alanyl-D-alanine carboxypeptidase/D-alanyl-D-alanine-endopeptidase (penicillin-binding protein 4)
MRVFSVALSLILCVSTSTFGFEKALEKTLSASRYKNTDVSIIVEKLSPTQNHTLYSLNPQLPLIPASILKLLVSAASLDFFGSQLTFPTEIYADSYPLKGVIHGDVYIVGKGDPGLKDIHLEKAVTELIEKGVHTINGNIVYDDSFFDSEPPKEPPSARYYYTPPSALNLDYNSVDFQIVENSDLNIREKTEMSYVQLMTKNSEIMLLQKPYQPSITFKETSQGDVYTLQGKVSLVDQKNYYLKCLVSRPGLFVASRFKDHCKIKGISVKGVRSGAATKQGIHLHTITSQTVSDLLTELNKKSNNMVAEVLTKNLGAYFDSRPGTKKKGLKILSEYLSEITTSEFTLDDGSGLSKKNRLSGKNVMDLLSYIYKNKEMYEILLDCLIDYKVDAYYSSYIPPENVEIRLKTGTLSRSGVNASAGYITLKGSSDSYAFVILANKEDSPFITYTGTLTTPILKAIVESIKDQHGSFVTSSL